VKNLFEKAYVFDGAELPDGREIFSVKEQARNGGDNCNFWTVRLDPRTGGRILGETRPLSPHLSVLTDSISTLSGPMTL
jgi:hypothetical protein